jgi:hypothetical protein
MIFYECYADESLLRFLGFDSRKLKGGHSFGRRAVSKKLQKNHNCWALVDEDPEKAKDDYLREIFRNSFYEDANLLVSRDTQRGHKIIILRPDLENWVIRLARDSKVSLNNSKYNLSSNADQLHSQLSLRNNVRERGRFKEFMEEISTHKTIVKLKELIKN